MSRGRSLLSLAVVICAFTVSFAHPQCASAQEYYFEDPPIDRSGKPTFVVHEIKPGSDLRILAYGDMRFTDPANTTDTNPRVRKWLAEKVAQEKPDALLVSGDLPYRGGLKADWDVYRRETAPWTAEGLRVYPTLGNHELVPQPGPGYKNYFAEFPWLGGRRWYSVELGSVYVISLDSNGGHADRTFNPGEPQRVWLEAQLDHLPPGVEFVFLVTHMPLINDIQSEMIADIPTTTDLALRRYLEDKASHIAQKLIVISGHVHNYERFENAGVSYIISGGGGAKPYPIYARNPEDLYKGKEYPNFNYLIFAVHGKQAEVMMYRVADPKAATLGTEVKERFTLKAK